MSGFSPLGRVAESCRTMSWRTAPVLAALAPPLRYLDLGLSLESMKEFAIRARARVVPDIDDRSSLEMKDSGREGESAAFDEGRAELYRAEDAPTPAEADRAICTFERLLGIFIGAGACLRACGGSCVIGWYSN